MHRTDELALMREIIGLSQQKLAFLDDAITHSPIERYASPERFHREHSAILRRVPVVAARAEDLANPNDFVTRDIAGLPVLLVRDDAGAARAYLNVCRHRGARLERDGQGCKRVFTCPYHGWSYSNRGDLRAVPQESQGFPNMLRAERGLRRLPVAEAYGFLWVVANPDATGPLDIPGWLAGLGADLDWLNLDQHRVVASDQMTIAANWKLLVEGGLEAYHFRVAHKKTIAPFFPDNLSTYRQFGRHIRSVLPRVTLMDLHDRPETTWSIRQDANLLYTLMPTTQLLVQQDHVVWVQLDPLDQDQTRVMVRTLAPRTHLDQTAHWQKNQQITLATLTEDFTLGAEIQSGFASRGNPSHLFGRFEGALNRFNLSVEEMLA